MPTNYIFQGVVGAGGVFQTTSSNSAFISAAVDDGNIAVGDAVTVSGPGMSSSMTTASGVSSGGTAYYLGEKVFDGQVGYVFGVDPTVGNNTKFLVLFNDASDLTQEGNEVRSFANSSPTSADLGSDPVCFAKGTQIATPTGPVLVEDLAIGDVILSNGGKEIPVKWIGRQTIGTRLGEMRCNLVRICAGALGDDLPHSDLTVTGDHGMIIAGLVINASALVNGGSIDWVPMAELSDSFTVYHIETEAHDVIFANGAVAETFVDVMGRMTFDNHAEYLDLYGAERIIPEMDRPRIASRRLLPDAIKARLGIVDDLVEFEGLHAA